MAKRDYHKDNKSFMIYKEWEDIVKELDNIRQVGELFLALFAYARGGEVPDFRGAQKIVFTMMTNQLDRDGKKWEDTCEKRRNSINKRWKADSDDETDSSGTPDDDENASAYKSIHKNSNHTDKEEEKEKVKEKEKEEEEEEGVGEDMETDAYAVCAASPDGTAVLSRTSEDNKPVVHKRKYGKYSNVLLSDDEFDDLYSEHPDVYMHYIARLSEHMALNHKDYPDHYSLIRDWIRWDMKNRAL